MSEHIYKLNIADLSWTVHFPCELEVGISCEPFLNGCANEDIVFTFCIGDPDYHEEKMIRERGPKVWRGKDYYRIERFSGASSQPRTVTFLRDREPSALEGFICHGYENDVNTMEKVLGISEMEVFLAQFGTISLHSSLIRYKGKTILFSAPSGTGKSTQAELWAQYRNAEQLNGDRSLIRKSNGEWIAYGSPFAGSSGIYRNEGDPICAIVLLRQADDNHVQWVSASKAFRNLYSETVMPRWNQAAHNRIMDILTEIADIIPVCELQCTPDERAVEVLDRFLQGAGL